MASKRDQFRNKFQATKVDDLKKIVKKDDSSIPSSRGSRTDFLTIDDGMNKFRIYPKHEGEKNFYIMRGVHWLTVDLDNGETGRRTVLNAKIHAGWKRDVVDAYIDYCKKNLDGDDADDADKIKKMVSWQDGIMMATTWVCYADKIAKEGFGMLEFKKTVRDAMNNESIIEDEDESISVDPYTDIDEGKPILITYNGKAKKAADYYKVQLSKKAVPLTDAQLEAYESLTPLSKLDMFKYTPEMFEMALSGIKNYDEEHEIDLFDSDEFQEIIEEIRSQFDGVEEEEEEEESSKSKKSTTKKSTKKVEVEEEEEEEDDNEEEEEEDDEEVEEVEEEEEEEEEGDEYDDMDRSQLKSVLKKKRIEFKVTTKTTDDEIRDAIRSASEVFEEEEEEEEEDEPEVTTKAKTTSKKTTSEKPKTLEEIKADLRKKQGK